MVFAPLNRWVSGHTGPVSPVEASLPLSPRARTCSHPTLDLGSSLLHSGAPCLTTPLLPCTLSAASGANADQVS